MSTKTPPPDRPLWVEAIRLRDAGELEAATKPLVELIALEPSLAMGHAMLGHLLRELGRYDEAIPNFRRAVTLRPKNWLFSSALFNTLLRAGRPQEGVDEAKRYVAIVDSDDPPKNIFPDLQMYRDWIDTDPSEFPDLLRGLKEVW